MSFSKDACIFSLTANKELTREVAKILGVNVSEAIVTHFADGETLCEPTSSFRGKNCYVIQSTCKPVNERLMEILIFADALKRASAKSINVVMPYFGYARQDRKNKPRQPITGRLVADLIHAAGIDRVVVIDLHAPQIQGFFTCLVDEMTAIPFLAKYFKDKVDDDWVIVSPDHGGMARARRVAEFLNKPLAIIDKRRPKPNEATISHVIGDVKGKHCLVIDDIIDTGGSSRAGAIALLEHGAKSVRIAATHGVFSPGAEVKLYEDNIFKEIVVTDSIPTPEHMKGKPLTVLSLALMIAKAIEHINSGKSLTIVYEMFSNTEE
ncbi:MAG: ribose-phosphate diphosphokinase [Bacilli bacterium]|jgi:ribose-phosphate pyrophosphokinase|nr:ribose-phosphate pyrophosphokinase [Bacillota bacterium]NLI52490.1 ribose-phosphate pyrophosphokinase [Erysipelotrichaceae bacterium]OQC50176.1 MAG: Ribose-phosphate pyrophosphokinase [Tenericutes bacterium ADurb.Bin024]HOE54347.1 ribose-phosphate pyrophosphokinase [Bacilli bacterium]HOM32052.1 ribose-phosphate pyrophosphokinase [Bacilli bacterium]